MHKGVILIVRADDRQAAVNRAEQFLLPYGDGDVWDWYVIGGRWSGELTGYEPQKDPRNEEQCTLCHGTGMRNDKLGKKMRKEDPTYTCNGCGGKGRHVKWPTDWEPVNDNVMPLTDQRVVAKVKEWSMNWKKKCLAQVAQGKERWKEDEHMLNYFERKRLDIEDDKFTFDSDVFDVDRETNRPPKDHTGCWAVMVDMHN